MIVSVKKTWSNRSADASKAQEIYDVLTEGAVGDDEILVRDASGLPAYRQPLETDPLLRCTTRTAKAVGRTLWKVTVDFAKDTPGTDSGGGSTNGWVVSYGSAEFSDVCDIDADGVPIVNPVGDPLEPPIMRPWALCSITAVKEFPLMPPWTVQTLVWMLNQTNNAGFCGFRPGSVKMTGFGVEPFIGPDKTTWRRQRLEFLVRMYNEPGGGRVVDWKERRMVSGVAQRSLSADPATAKFLRQQITDSLGHPVNQPVPLSDDGRALGVGDKPVWKLWKIYTPGDFSLFGFGT